MAYLNAKNRAGKFAPAVFTLCLVPAAAWGLALYGSQALLPLLAAIASALVVEGLYNAYTKKFTLQDGSAFLCGLLIGLSMPPDIALFIPCAAAAFAVAVVKISFGAAGQNWMNPAAAGRVFAMISWAGAFAGKYANPNLEGPLARAMLKLAGAAGPAAPQSAGGFIIPAAVSSATPLTAVKSAMHAGAQAAPHSSMLDLYNSMEKANFTWGNLLAGAHGGAIGEGPALFLIIGGLVLVALRITPWRIPAAFLGVFALLVWLLGGLPFGFGLFQGDALFNILTGGLLLGAFFFTADSGSTPKTAGGQLIFGAGCGFFAFLLRFYGSQAEGVVLAIILMNVFTPLINRASQAHLAKKEAAV